VAARARKGARRRRRIVKRVCATKRTSRRGVHVGGRRGRGARRRRGRRGTAERRHPLCARCVGALVDRLLLSSSLLPNSWSTSTIDTVRDAQDGDGGSGGIADACARRNEKECTSTGGPDVARLRGHPGERARTDNRHGAKGGAKRQGKAPRQAGWTAKQDMAADVGAGEVKHVETQRTRCTRRGRARVGAAASRTADRGEQGEPLLHGGDTVGAGGRCRCAATAFFFAV